MEQQPEGGGGDSLSEEDFQALLLADKDRLVARAAESPCWEARKPAKRRRLQKPTGEPAARSSPPTTSSGGHFRRPDEGCGEGTSEPAEQPDGQEGGQPPISAASTEPAACPRDSGRGPGMGTKAAQQGSFHFSPELFSWMRQTVRKEMENLFRQGRVRSDHAPSPPPASPSLPRHDRSGGVPVAAERIRGPIIKGAQKESGSRKRGRGSPLRGPDPSLEGHIGDREEEEDVGVPAQSTRFFKAEDYQYLLSKTLAALDLQEAQGGEEQTPTAPGLKRRPGGKGEFPPRSGTNKKVFPFPELFERQIKAEWSKPMADRRCPDFIKKLYALPAYAEELLQVPRVDAAVTALQSSSLLSEDGHGSLRDSTDKRAGFALRKTHEALAMTIKASSAASIASRAGIVWTRKLLQLIPGDNRRLNEGANRILKALSFTADATLDAMIFSSRAMASGVVARRALWLRAWQADERSKDIVLAFPFQGKRLFGDALDRILVETRDKKKALPRTLRHNDRRPFGNYSFRAQHVLPRFKQEVRRSNWYQSR